MIRATKLHIPQPDPRTLVERPRLTAAMEKIDPQAGPVLLVQAPAGFGKTTALAQWLRTGVPSPAWVSLDPGDNHPRTFWAHVFTALDGQYPGNFAPLAARLEEGGLDGPALATAMANQIHQITQNAPGPTLVLDDLHRIQEREILDSLNFLVDHPLAGFTLVLSSRTRPPMGLSRLRSLGRLMEITARDLAFTPHEIQTLTRDLVPPLSRRGLDHIGQKTEGWITGIKLALISREENPDLSLEGLTGTAAHIRDYLLEEVFGNLPAPLQTLMARLSILERFSPALCDLLGELPHAIEEMERRHLFLIPLDQSGQWYRFHHLFQEFLARRLNQTTDPAPLHSEVAEHFHTQGLFEEAFAHALAAHRPELAARIISPRAPDLYARGGDESLLPYLKQLPPAVIREELPLYCYAATIRIYNGEFQVLEEMKALRDNPPARA
ncbi:MAG: hypothetical protein MI747_01230, partial [Desulfobacterales bacterium]|nr:hypothetical protein [Desulfobacterales bacterium]